VAWSFLDRRILRLHNKYGQFFVVFANCLDQGQRTKGCFITRGSPEIAVGREKEELCVQK
jgi:hypothetical protein